VSPASRRVTGEELARLRDASRLRAQRARAPLTTEVGD
jgi:hypothetical protein